MAWKIEFTASADKSLEKMDPPIARRILKFLEEKVAPDPKVLGDQLKGTLSEYWRYKMGDYRILCVIEEEKIEAIPTSAETQQSTNPGGPDEHS